MNSSKHSSRGKVVPFYHLIIVILTIKCTLHWYDWSLDYFCLGRETTQPYLRQLPALVSLRNPFSSHQVSAMYGNPTQISNVVTTVYDYEKDMRLSIQLNRWILKPIGVWPKSGGISWTEKYIYVLVNIIFTSLIGFLFIPCATYVTLELEDTYNTLKLSGPLNFCLMAVVKYSSLIFHENDIYRGIEYIENDWTNTQYYDDQIIMIRNAKFGRRLVAVCVFFMYGGLVFYYLALPLSSGKITEDDGNLTYRPLVYPVARVIIDARHSPVSEIFFWMQCLSGFIVHSITACACSLAAIFAMHAYGRLEVLIQWIEHLVDGREDFCDSVDERLAMIVQQHVRILKWVSNLNKDNHWILYIYNICINCVNYLRTFKKDHIIKYLQSNFEI